MVRKSTLGEISFVDLGADGATSASVAAIANPESGAETVNDTDTATLDEPITPPTTSATGVVATSPVDDIRAQAAAEVERIAAIRRICAGKNAGLEARAIREGWDAQRIELEILRTTRPSAPAVHVPDNSVTATTAACGGRWCG